MNTTTAAATEIRTLWCAICHAAWQPVAGECRHCSSDFKTTVRWSYLPAVRAAIPARKRAPRRVAR